MIEAILGSKTKVKILEILTKYPDGLTRNKIAEYSLLHPNNIYDQIDDLLFLDIVKKQNKNYLLNPDHALYDTFKSFFQVVMEYSNQFSSGILSFLHSKLTNHYYITGYFSATRMITPIDYSENVLNVVILKDQYTYFSKKFSLLTTTENISYQKVEAGKLTLFTHEQDFIPADIKIEKINGQEIYLSSITRGTIDCFRYEGVSDYGKCLILLQNETEGLLDNSLLIKEYEQSNLPLTLQFVLKEMAKMNIGTFQQFSDLKEKTKQIKERKKLSLEKALKEAITTVQGTY